MRVYYHRSLPYPTDLDFFSAAVEADIQVVLLLPAGRRKFYHSDADRRCAGYSDKILMSMFKRYL